MAQPFILDLGTDSIRVGHAGDALPRITTYPVLGLPLTNTLQPCTNVALDASARKLALEHSFFPLIPHVKKDRMDPLFAFYYNAEGHYDADFEALERLVEDIAATKGVDENLAEANVLLVEPNVTTDSFRENLVNIFVEALQVNSVYLGRRAPFTCYASASISATVVDVGASCTSVAPVLEGYVSPQYVQQAPVAGNLIDRAVNALLNSQGLRVRPPFAVAERDGKVEMLSLPFVTPNYYHWAAMRETARLKHQLLLPDGNAFEPETNEMIRAMANYILLGQAPAGGAISFDKISAMPLPERATFQISPPSLSADSCDSALATGARGEVYFESSETLSQYINGHGLVGMVEKALDASQVRSGMLILSGGSTTYAGFAEVFKGALSERLSGQLEFVSVGGEEQQYSSFIGASILSSLGGYPHLCLTRAEVAELGVHRALAKKCP